MFALRRIITKRPIVRNCNTTSKLLLISAPYKTPVEDDPFNKELNVIDKINWLIKRQFGSTSLVIPNTFLTIQAGMNLFLLLALIILNFAVLFATKIAAHKTYHSIKDTYKRRN